MRSRYSAYARQNIAYLVETTHPDKREKMLAQQVADWAEQVEFIQLEVVKTLQGGAADRLGKVEFIAHFSHQGERRRLHEISRFKRFKSRWMYLDGSFPDED